MNLQQEFNELKQQHEKEIIEGLNTSLEEDDEIRKGISNYFFYDLYKGDKKLVYGIIVETECIQLREEVTLLHEAKRSTLEQTVSYKYLDCYSEFQLK
jgi:hypothetical protein